jgi:DNA-binding LytR/AlgR family response regulator
MIETRTTNMRALIIADEPLARTAIANVLAKRHDVENFESAGDVIDAVSKLSSACYDVLVLDLSMPELTGLGLLDRMKTAGQAVPPVVFVTAHEQHAIAAFEQHAVDYVLKPFANERLNEALDVASRRTDGARMARPADAPPQRQQLSRQQPSQIAIKANGRIFFIDPAQVVTVQAQGNYVLLRRETGSYLLRGSISVMAEKLKPYGFVRIHRSVLVNRLKVDEIKPWTTGEYGLRLKDGKEYTVTRTYKKNLKELATSWIGTDAFS